MDKDFEKIISNISQKRMEVKAFLERKSYKNEKISKTELANLFRIKERLTELAYEYEKLEKGGELNSEQKKLSFFDEVTRWLDKESVWKWKFTTSSADDSSSLEINPTNDSVYYVSRSGVSLRLKKTNLFEKGLKGTIQPFAETIFFINPENKKISETPQEEYWVVEYTSQEFHNLEKGGKADKDFISPIKKFLNDAGKLFFVEEPVNLFHRHEGHAVNRILTNELQS